MWMVKMLITAVHCPSYLCYQFDLSHNRGGSSWIALGTNLFAIYHIALASIVLLSMLLVEVN